MIYARKSPDFNEVKTFGNQRTVTWRETNKAHSVKFNESRTLEKMKYIFLLILFLFTDYAIALEKNYFHSPESSNDVRFDYDLELLKLALEKNVF